MLIGNLKKLEAEGIKQHGESIKSDYIDTEIYKDAIKDTNALKDKIDERSEESPFFNKLSQDIFNAFYKIRPEMYDKQNVSNSLKMEHDILSELINNESFEKLRKNTACDLFNSTYGLSTFQDKAYTIIKEWIKESPENQQMMDNINKVLEHQETMDDLLAQLQLDPDNTDLQAKADVLQDLLDKENEALGGDLNNPPNTTPMNGINDKLSNALGETQKDVQQSNDEFNNFFNMGGAGNDRTDNPMAVSYEDRIRVSEKLKENSKLKEISKHLGKMREFMGKINKKPSKIGTTIADIGIGNSISRSLSSEKMLLTDSNLENQFYKKYLDRGLMQYDVRGIEKMKGPIVVCVDDSGSMRGTRDYWAKAIALAMLQLAMKDRRNYRCIIFSNGVDAVFDFDRKNFKPEEVIKMAAYFQSGGTSFYPALSKALESIEDSRYKKADILFITDGEPSGYLPKTFKNRLRIAKIEKEFIIQGIVIGSISNTYLDEFCDTVTTFKDLNKDGELVNIFKNVKNDNSKILKKDDDEDQIN